MYDFTYDGTGRSVYDFCEMIELAYIASILGYELSVVDNEVTWLAGLFCVLVLDFRRLTAHCYRKT